MVKFIYCFLVLLFLLSYVSHSQNMSAEGLVSVKIANVYEKPDVKSKKLRSLSQNIHVNVLMTQGDWYFIEAQGKEGWIKKSDVKLIIKTEAPSEQRQPEQIKTTEPPKVIEQKPRQEKSYFNETNYFSPYTYGVKAGLNISSVQGDDIPISMDARKGFCAGVFFIYRLSGGFGLQGELLYNQKGFVQSDSTSKIDYVSLPILLRYTFDIGKISPFVNAGAEFSYNTNKGLKTADNTYVYDDIKPFDVGLSFGLGAGYNLTGISSLILDIRYTMGLSTIHDKTVHNTEELDLKNSVLSITFGYTF
jgi:opacity protein-like surface antigen